MDLTCVRQQSRDDNEPLDFSSTLSVGNVCVIPDLRTAEASRARWAGPSLELFVVKNKSSSNVK